MGTTAGRAGTVLRRLSGTLSLAVLAGCGQAPNPEPADPSPTASPTITATPSPSPTKVASPPPGMMPRGIPVLRDLDAEAARYAATLADQLDKREPRHTHTVTCTPVMLLGYAGAHTPCEVSTDGGAPVLWTALAQEHPDPPGGGSYIEFTVGERKDVNPWPPNLPAPTPTTS